MEDINHPPKPSAFVLYGSLFIFLSATFGCFSWFKVDLTYLLNELVSYETVLTFDNVVFFGLGGGISFGAFSLPFVLSILFNRPKPETNKKIIKIVNRTFIFIVAIAFIIAYILPHFARDYLDDYMITRGYNICDVYDPKMILYRKVIYTNTTDACTDLISKDCAEFSWKCK